MSKSVFCYLLAVGTMPLFTKTVSSTSIQIISQSDLKNKNPLAEQTTIKQVDIVENIYLRDSLAKIPAISVQPQSDFSSFSLDSVSDLISSVMPLDRNIKKSISVSVKETTDVVATSKIESSNRDRFPKFSRNSFLSTKNNSKLAHPAPETERVASVFGWRIRPFSGRRQMHNGIDYGAPLGSPVVAAEDGIVTKVVTGCLDFRQRWCGSQFGNWIEINHGNGMIATYAHLLNNSITVKEGTKVWKNQEIAKVGSSGWSTGAHLDFRVKINGDYKNPDRYVGNL